jgi:hypothetical protein
VSYGLVPRLRRPGPLIVCLALSAALLVATADVAGASLFLVFDRTSGRPATVVRVHTGGNGACVVCPPRLRLYFARAAIADGITSPTDPRIVRVGRLTVDGQGNAVGVLTVPLVPNGRYVVLTYCEPCAPGSGGRTMLPLGPDPPFRVFGSIADRTRPSDVALGDGNLPLRNGSVARWGMASPPAVRAPLTRH